jgi:hypothetical protein
MVSGNVIPGAEQYKLQVPPQKKVIREKAFNVYNPRFLQLQCTRLQLLRWVKSMAFIAYLVYVIENFSHKCIGFVVTMVNVFRVCPVSRLVHTTHKPFSFKGSFFAPWIYFG